MSVATFTAAVIFAYSQMGLPNPETLPTFEITNKADVVEMTGKDGAIAYYNHDTRTLVFSDELDWDDPYDISMIVHEAVHDAQHQSGTKLACMAEGERDAYLIQDKFLQRFGKSIFVENDPNGFVNQLAFKLFTNCMMGIT